MRQICSASGPAATRGGPWRLSDRGLWLPVWWPRPIVRAGPSLLDVDRIVDSIAWHPHNPLVRRAIDERACADGCSTAQVRRRELRAALYLALAERARPQTHRFGRRWLTDENGRAALAVPNHLPWSYSSDGWSTRRAPPARSKPRRGAARPYT